jgi:hypothetical protein
MILPTNIDTGEARGCLGSWVKLRKSFPIMIECNHLAMIGTVVLVSDIFVKIDC